jgi:hypothetical protein
VNELEKTERREEREPWKYAHRSIIHAIVNMMTRRRGEKKNEEEEFWEKKEKKGNITIALFNPERGTNKHVLSSFKKVSVFFSFSALCSEREREKK